LHQFHKNNPWGSQDFTCVATWLGLATGSSMDLHSVWITHHAKQVAYKELKEDHFFITSDISTTVQLLI